MQAEGSAPSRAGRIATSALGIVLAALFVAAAVPKLLEPSEFALAIQNYRLVPDAWVGPVALFVPVFELVVALGLVLRGHQRGAALLAAVMLLAFAAAMAQARLRGIDLSCGCFGAALEGKVSWFTVARTFGFGMMAALLFWLTPSTPVLG